MFTEIDFTMLLLFPWKSFTDFHGMKFFYLQISGDPFQIPCVETYLAGEHCR